MIPATAHEPVEIYREDLKNEIEQKLAVMRVVRAPILDHGGTDKIRMYIFKA